LQESIFSPTQEKLKNKKSSLLQKNKTSFHRTLQTLPDTTLNVNRFGQSVCKLETTTLRTDRRASGNSGFKKLAVQWLNQVQFSNQISCRLTVLCSEIANFLNPQNVIGNSMTTVLTSN
jgi:hypothetical protein